MSELILASNNKKKMEELRTILADTGAGVSTTRRHCWR